jgi:GNAT superfamily N-acetyltransferase
MELKSVGRQSDLIIAKHFAHIENHENRLLIKSPTLPEYHWGNFIVFDKGPQKGDLIKWTEQFRKDFPYYVEPTHYVFSWNPVEIEHCSGVEEFIADGFSLENCEVIASSKLQLPAKANKDVEVKILQTDSDWEQALACQLACWSQPETLEIYIPFKTKQMKMYRELSQKSVGHWFGAFIGDKLVADLGVFHDNMWGRYQSVGTLPEFRNQGICSRLVYEAGVLMLERYGLEKLLIEAERDYHALQVYKKVGFETVEVNYSLSKSFC